MDKQDGTVGVLTRIERAFPVGPAPTDDHLVEHVCAECDDLRRLFRGVQWTDLPDKVIDENFDKLPLLTAEAFVYYVPAYIRRAVLNPQEKDCGLSSVLTVTVYSLCDQKLPDDHWWRERAERFTREQESAVAVFLRWVVALGESGNVDQTEIDGARCGLARYWNSRSRSDDNS